MLKKIYFAFFLPAIVVPSVAQTTSSFYLPSNIKSAYEKGTRSPDGSPGKNYWQNSGDYELKIKFDPATRLLDGSEVITYYNNSPDTLHQLLFRLYPNYYKKNELRDQVVRYEDENEGVIIDKLVIGGEEMDTAARAHRVVFNNTNMSVFCKSIFPKQKVKAEVKWHYTLNKGSHQRTGQVDAGAFFIAYCFPRVAVYDDVQGWDESVYMGVNEPYFDFGNFNAEVTVPKDYVVWGTGVLQNPETVLAPNILERYKASLTSDSVSLVVGMEDLAKNAVTAKNAWNTWVFRAEDVPDFSFAISDHYVWQSVSTVVDPSTKRRTVINTAFNPEHTDFFDVNFFSRRTVEVMSNDFPGVPYPYPHITVFDGLDQMEYPMMVNDNPLESKAETVELTDHEIFHTFFPFYMGINQTKYAWMDEGWATIGEWYISPKIDSTLEDDYGMDRIKKSTGKDFDLPLIIPSTETKLSYYINAYPKPGLIYLYLKDMLGDEVFRKAIQYYMAQWHGKHPVPWDFFNCVNKASGQNLDWFWQNWFYGWASMDLAIKNVSVKGANYKVTVKNKGGRPVPVYLQVKFADGTKRTYHETAGKWKDGKTEFVINVNEKKEVASMKIKYLYVPDAEESDNFWRNVTGKRQ